MFYIGYCSLWAFYVLLFRWLCQISEGHTIAVSHRPLTWSSCWSKLETSPKPSLKQVIAQPTPQGRTIKHHLLIFGGDAPLPVSQGHSGVTLRSSPTKTTTTTCFLFSEVYLCQAANSILQGQYHHTATLPCEILLHSGLKQTLDPCITYLLTLLLLLLLIYLQQLQRYLVAKISLMSSYSSKKFWPLDNVVVVLTILCSLDMREKGRSPSVSL